MTEQSHNRTGGPGVKEKQEKPSVQSTEEQQKEQAIEDRAHHGGRSKWPDGDVNPAPDIHVEDDETAKPAETAHHDARRRKDHVVDDEEDEKKPRGR